MPGDRGVASVESAVVHVASHRVVHVANQSIVQREPGSGRQVALRDAERHVDALDVAPLRHDVSMPHDHPARRTPVGRRPEDLGVGLLRDELLDGTLHVPRPGIFVRFGEDDGRGHGRGVHPHLCGPPVLPGAARGNVRSCRSLDARGDGRSCRRGWRTRPDDEQREDGEVGRSGESHAPDLRKSLGEGKI